MVLEINSKKLAARKRTLFSGALAKENHILHSLGEGG